MTRGGVLLVEPDYRSSYPPLGLLKISSWHKQLGDEVVFTRGKNPDLLSRSWGRIYVSSLFTYELKRTVETIGYYARSLRSDGEIYTGGIAATLIPDYINQHASTNVIVGHLDRAGLLGVGSPLISDQIPDYPLIDSSEYGYHLQDAFFCRTSVGCVRSCTFCAVPRLEPSYKELDNWDLQVLEVRRLQSDRQHLILLDNNILAHSHVKECISKVVDLGFGRGARRNRRRRLVDISQGIDARLVSFSLAKELSRINLHPVRLAFDSTQMSEHFETAMRRLAASGFTKFVNYMLYNYNDTPHELYKRMNICIKLGRDLEVNCATFPMRYIPCNAIKRGHVGNGWTWKHLRGMQCILVGTRGIVSPNPSYFYAAFGASPEEFEEILTMPDRFIIYRNRYRLEIRAWQVAFRRLSNSRKREFLEVLYQVHKELKRENVIKSNPWCRELLEHHYPNGKAPRE